MSTFRYNRDFLIEFLEIYRQNECLWKVKSREYMDRDKKFNAYKKLRDKLLEVDSNATIETAKKKINSVRTNFRAEFKKVLISQNSGVSEEDLYSPSLWYYDQLLFLVDQEAPTWNGINLIKNDPLRLESEESTYTNESSSTSKRKAQKRVKANVVAKAEGFLKQAEEALKNKEDSFDIYGKHLACELRALDSQDTVYVKKFFNDILFEAKIGNIRNVQLKAKNESSQNTKFQNVSPIYQPSEI